MARSLARRIAVAFAALSLAVLVGTGGALFLALRTLHTEAQDARLTDLADGSRAAAAARRRRRSPREVLEALRDDVPEEVGVTFRTADGRLVRLGDAGPAAPIDADPGSAAGAISHGSAVDTAGRPLRYALVAVRLQAAGNARAVIVSTPDIATDLATRDVAPHAPRRRPRAAPRRRAHRLAALAVRGTPAPGPVRRDGQVPRGASAPLPLGGPTEVRELTGHFNADDPRARATAARGGRPAPEPPP